MNLTNRQRIIINSSLNDFRDEVVQLIENDEPECEWLRVQDNILVLELGQQSPKR